MRTLAPHRSAAALAAALLAVAACADAVLPPTAPVALVASTDADAASASADLAPLRPAEGDRVLFDSRASLQTVGSVRDAVRLWDLDKAPKHWGFTKDMDGAGTNALRVEWPGRRNGCEDESPELSTELPDPRPHRLYVQWKHLMGRTRTGGGTGEVGTFELTNPSCPREGRMVGMITRAEGDAEGRVELRWLGPPPVAPRLTVKDKGISIAPDDAWFRPQDHVGEVLEHTLYAQTESHAGARDGVVRLWVNGRLLLERTGLALGTKSFRRFKFPWTMTEPRRSQTEYFWDVVAWTAPVASVTASPGQGELDIGESLRLATAVRDAIGSPIFGLPVAFESSDPAVATVSADGTVTAVEPGEATISATVEGRVARVPVKVRGNNEFFVAADGTPGGRGTRGSPLDLATALAGAGGRIGPGAVVWVRGGTYRGVFESDLVGTAEAPVVVRAFPGERATIDGNLTVEGSDITIWGLELMQTAVPAGDSTALFAKAPGGRYINLVIHDARENGVSLRSTTGYSELYGSIVYNNGNNAGLDQGIYAPNDAGEKRITDNVFFNNMASGIQVYASDEGDEDELHGRLTNVHVEGNISFNNSSIASRMAEENVTVGGTVPTERMSIVGNLLFSDRGTGANLRFGLAGRENRDVIVRGNYVVGSATVVRTEDFASAVVEDNTFIGSERMVRLTGPVAGHRWANNVHHRDPAADAWNWNGTRYTFDDFRAATGIGGADRAVAEMPTAPKIFVRPNRYERGRAHIGVVNWGGAASVAVDVTGVLRAGDRWELRNVQDVWGAPVAAGVYAGGAIDVPLTGVEPPVAEGRPGRPRRTAPAFDAFLLTIVPAEK